MAGGKRKCQRDRKSMKDSTHPCLLADAESHTRRNTRSSKEQSEGPDNCQRTEISVITLQELEWTQNQILSRTSR